MSITRHIILGVLCVGMLLPVYANAQNNKGLPDYQPLEPLTTEVGPLEKGRVDQFPALVNALFKLFLGLGAILAVASLVWGGITYMVSEIADKKMWAVGKIKSALWGLLLLLGAFVILNTIDPGFTRISFELPSTLTPTNSSGTTNTTPTITDAQSCGTQNGTPHVGTTCAAIGSDSPCVDYTGGACVKSL